MSKEEIIQDGDANGFLNGDKSEIDEAIPNVASDWLIRREIVVQRAIDEYDLEKLRELAALPGGFGSNEMRKKVWPILLNTKHYHQEGKPNFNEEVTVGSGQTERSIEAGEDVSNIESNEKTETVNEGHEVKHDLDDNSEVKKHPDEHQVSLDTNRSFVSYPKDLPSSIKSVMQADLQDLIVGVLRKFPGLHYFQGYHDILSVLYLTYIPLPEPPSRSRSRPRVGRRTRSASRSDLTLTPVSKSEELEGKVKVDGTASGIDAALQQVAKDDSSNVEEKLSPKILTKSTLSSPSQDERRGRKLDFDNPSRDSQEWQILRQCSEVISLCRVRDAMGKGMEGMMGFLRILKRLLKVADPELSSFSASISPVPTLPFFALSWILCLFSHEVDTLEPIQRMFDFLLSRNPVSAIYLAVAILIAKKPQMLKLAKELDPEAMDDPSLLHPLFARLPPFFADTPATPIPSAQVNHKHTVTSDRIKEENVNPYQPISLSEIFRIADELLAKYPWDGPDIRGKDVMGEGSILYSYDLEHSQDWTLDKAMSYVDKEVVIPGAAMFEDEDEDDEMPPPKPITRRPVYRIRVPRYKVGTAIAVGVVLVGIGIAVLGYKSGGSKSGWGKWWAVVVQGWVMKGLKGGGYLETWLDGLRDMTSHVSKIWSELLHVR